MKPDVPSLMSNPNAGKTLTQPTSMLKKPLRQVLCGMLVVAMTGCGTQQLQPSEGHIKSDPPRAANLPPPVLQAAPLPKPKATPKQETYSVVVNQVPVRELLFSLARDAKINVDIHSGVEGNITLNALEQSLPQLLTRIAKQVDMRWELDGPNLVILPDTPYLKNYRVDYVNMTRESTSVSNIATTIASTGTGSVGQSGTTAGGGSTTGSNSSSSTVSNTSNNRFWTTLIQNVRDLLRETDKLLPEGSTETTVEQTRTETTTGTGAPQAPAQRTTPPTSVAGSPNPATLLNAGETVTRRATFREAASVIANQESGVIAVRATSRQHERIQEFLDQVLASARRQVLIEATVIEVRLNDQYQSGIDWKRLAMGSSGFSLFQNSGNTVLPTTNMSSVINPLADTTRRELIERIMANTDLSQVQKANLINQIAPGMGDMVVDEFTGLDTVRGTYGSRVPTADPVLAANQQTFLPSGNGFTVGYYNLGSLAYALKLLQGFGTTRVLSSPKISALNNQPAILKVVDNRVYFTVNVTVTAATANSAGTRDYVTTINTIPVGFVMNVTPQIDENDMVTLNVRPTISRIIRYVADPNPVLASAGTQSLIPEIQVRELESVLKVGSGQTAIMGGLMQDEATKTTEGIPGVSKIPFLSEAFNSRNDAVAKTELVIFLKPTVIKEPSLDGDFKAFRKFLPDKDYFKDTSGSPENLSPKAEPAKP